MKKLFILLAAFCAGCQLLGQTSTLPATCPTDLRLTYHYDGGMRYYSEDLLLSKDSCVFEKNDAGKKIRNKFVLTTAEFDAFYELLKTNRFDKIEYKTESGVYDRGGISMELAWNKGQREMRVSNSQMSFVKERWIKEWQAICDHLSGIIKEKTKK